MGHTFQPFCSTFKCSEPCWEMGALPFRTFWAWSFCALPIRIYKAKTTQLLALSPARCRISPLISMSKQWDCQSISHASLLLRSGASCPAHQMEMTCCRQITLRSSWIWSLTGDQNWTTSNSWMHVWRGILQQANCCLTTVWGRR